MAEGAVLQTIKYLLSCHLSSPPQRRGQGWWFALPRSSAGAIKMRPRLPLERICAQYGRCFASFVSSRSLALGGSWGTAPSVFWFLLYAQKERPGGEPYRPSPFGDSATPIGDYKLSPRRVGVLPKPCTRPHPPPGDHQPAPKYHNKSQLYFPSKAHYLCNSRPKIPSSVNFPLKKVKY